MAAVSSSSSFHCFSLPSSHANTASSPARSVRFQKSRPISAVCAAPPAAKRAAAQPASLYDVLGIQTEASCQEIKAAYRRLARVLHPDAVGANGQNDASADDFIRVHEAYATLSDPGKRADYDRTLFIRRRLMEGSSSSSFANAMQSAGRARGATASRFTRRSWETDQCW